MKKLIFTALLISQISTAETISKIIDGDTIKVLERQNSIRFDCIDTPESKMVGKQNAQIINGMNIGVMATKHLESLISVGDIVEMKCKTVDKYGRSVCEIFKNGVNINKKMVADGYAFIPTKYCKNPEYITAFKIAKRDKVGLHSIDGFSSQDPQKFRNCVRENSKQDCNK
jgi:endonuclease YncB( thermonuclease family)